MDVLDSAYIETVGVKSPGRKKYFAFSVTPQSVYCTEEKFADGGRLFARLLQRGLGANDAHRHCSQSGQEGGTGSFKHHQLKHFLRPQYAFGEGRIRGKEGHLLWKSLLVPLCHWPVGPAGVAGFPVLSFPSTRLYADDSYEDSGRCVAGEEGGIV